MQFQFRHYLKNASLFYEFILIVLIFRFERKQDLNYGGIIYIRR